MFQSYYSQCLKPLQQTSFTKSVYFIAILFAQEMDCSMQLEGKLDWSFHVSASEHG